MMSSVISHYKQEIQKLERELDDMTVALSHAWDQLVPFLQDVPEQVETSQDIDPILQAVLAAADTDAVSTYLFQSDQWYSIPHGIELPHELVEMLGHSTEPQLVESEASTGQMMSWAFVPIYSEREIVGGLGIGTYDADRSFTAVDLRIIERMADRIGTQIAATQLAHFREREVIRAREFQIANEIQQSVQPVAPPKNDQIRLASYWQPAKQVGGDAWGWIELPNRKLSWFILDVAGKGLPAALAAVALHTAISLALRMQVATAETLKIVNEQFYDAYTRTDLMATVAVLSFDPENGVLEIANAGHPPILIRQNRTWLRAEASVPPIGVLPFLEPEVQHFQLNQNDMVICYSDGFTEIQQEAGMWGETGLLKSVPIGAKNIEALTQHIVRAAQNAGVIEDDQTLVTMLYKGK